jgi:protein-disulfide isomerase
MLLFKRLLLLALILTLGVSAGLAQEATPTAPAEATADAATTTEEMETGFGIVTLERPSDWFIMPGQQGSILVANVDLAALGEGEAPPPEAVMIQIRIFSRSQLPPEIAAATTAREILEQTQQETETETEFEVNELELDDEKIIAFVDVSTEEADSTIYAHLLTDDLFIFAQSLAITRGDVAANADLFTAVLMSIVVDVQAAIPEDAGAAYVDLPQSTSQEGFYQLGDADAPVKIREISSFDCPHCRNFHDLALPIILERVAAGEVLFTYVPVFGTGGIPNGSGATVAAFCAGEQDVFWAYHDAIFSWQDFGNAAFLQDRFIAAAEDLELDIDVFTACLESDRPTEFIENGINEAKALGSSFQGTPTLLVNGVNVSWDPNTLNDVIDEALANPPAEATAEATEAP